MHSSKPVRILMFGRDEDLEITRKLLLNHAGYSVDVVNGEQSFKEHLVARERGYVLAILCQSLRKDERNACAEFAGRCNVKTLSLSEAIAPADFLRRISEIIQT
jgi:hypothetical protein